MGTGEPTHLKGMISFWEITFLRYLVALGIRLHMIRNHHIHIRGAKGTCVLYKIYLWRGMALMAWAVSLVFLK